MSVQIQLKRSTASAWTAANPTLASGEIGYETDTGKFKIGSGSTAWTSLSYANSNLSVASIDALSDVTITSAANGDFLRWNGTAWINDAVNLSTDTVGSFVESLVAGTGITLANNSGEGATPTVTVDTSVIQARVADVSDTEIGYLNGVTSAIQTQLDTKAPTASPTFTGTVTVPTPIGNTDASTKAYVDSTASTTASNASTALTNHEADTTNIHGIADTSILVTTTGTQALTNKTITSPSGLVKGDVGLGNVDNTSDANKPVSTAGQTALDLKAPLASPTFTGTVVLPDNTVALGTKTTGDYVATITGGTGVTSTAATTGESTTHTLSIGQAVGTTDNVTFAGVTADAIKVGVTAANEIDTTSGDLTIDSAGGTVTVDDNLVVTGNLTVSGTTTSINTETLTVDDNIVVLNNNVTGSPTENAGIEIERGTSANVLVRWNETNDKWEVTNDGTTYGNIVTTADSGTVTSAMITDGTIVNGDISSSADIADSKLATIATAGKVSNSATTATATAGNSTIVARDGSGNFAAGTITAALSGNASTATNLATPRAIEISGDVTGTANFDGSAAINITATIAANSVALGTDTTGNYVNDVTAGTGVTVTHTPAEGSSPTVAIGQSVATSAVPTFAGLNLNGNITFEGTTADDFETIIAVTDPTGDRVIVFPDLTGTVVTTGDTGSITSLMIADGTIVNADINASAGIAHSKLANATAGQVLLGTTATGVVTATTISGDITIDGAGVASIAANSVALGTDTTGNYVNDITAGTGVTVTHTPSEGSSPTIAIGQAVATNSNVTFNDLTVSGNLTVSGTTTTINSTAVNVKNQVVFEGATDDNFETTLTVVDPTADRTITFPDTTGTVALTSDVTTHANLTEAHGATGAVVGTTNTQTLTNKTLTSPKVNEDVVLTSTATELNILDGATLSTTELNYVDGVTSAIQTQIDTKAPSASPTFTGTVVLPDNTVALGTKTTGDYVATITGGTGVSSTASTTGEGTTHTLSIGQAIATTDSPTFAGLTVNGASVVFEGATANDFETTLTVTDPTADRTITIPDATGTVALTSDVTTHANLTEAHGATGAVVGTTNTQTLTNKTLTSPKINEDVVLTSTATELNYVDGVTSAIQTQIDTKAPLASPTFTGTVTVPTPTNATDAVTKGYADSITQSLDIKDSVRVASTANITIASALIDGSTIDGIVVATGDRVLLKNQTTASQNGVYVVAASGASSRSTDANTSAKVTSGMYVFVSEGTVSADMGYVLTTNDSITLGTTALSFTQFSGAGQITAGTGISKSGNTLSIDTTVTADLTTAQTLTNKTLTSPVVNTPTGIVKGDVGLGNVDNTSNATERAATATLTNKTLTSPVINTPTGIVKGDVGLGNVDNTADSAKPVSTAQQTALDLKANLASPTFTGTPTLPTGTIATTQTAGNNTTALATTAFVTTAVSGAAITALDDVGDVTITSASSGQFLKWNGTAWVNDAIDLGTDTTGSYVASLVAGTGVTLTNNSGEGATPTVTVDTAVIAPLAGPTFTGTVVLPSTTSIGTITSTELSYVDGVTSAIQTQINAKQATLVSATNIKSINGTSLLGSGDLTVGAAAPTTTSITANTATTIDSFALSTYRSSEFSIQVVQGTKYTVIKALILHDGTNADLVQYGVIEMGSPVIPLTLSADISGADVRLRATITDAATTNATAKVLKTTL